MSPLIILGFIGGLGVILLVVGLAITVSSERSLVEERLGRYIEEEEDILRAQRQADKERATPLGDWLNSLMEGSNLGGGISRELARADLKLKPAEYIATQLILGIFGAGLGAYLNRNDPTHIVMIAFGILGFLAGRAIPGMYVKRIQNQRLLRFGEQLSDMLNLMVNGLRAGYSTVQALESVSKEMPPPISDEFRRVVQEMQLGFPMEQALNNLLRRIPSEDLDLVITAMNVQREVGGNLAEILDTISFTIRERVRIKGEIRVLTTQVMYSGRFLAIMPILIALVLWVVNRPYMMMFFDPKTRIPGIIALVVATLLIIAGYFTMNKLGDIEV
jgi:tight adherence protein B